MSLSDLELAQVRAAAARSGVAAASWLGEAGVRAAAASEPAAAATVVWGPAMREVMGLRAELADARRLMRIAGGNLNDVAKHANSTGELHGATAIVQARVARAVELVEQTVAAVDQKLSEIRTKLAGWDR